MGAVLSTTSSRGTGNGLWQKSQTGCEEGVPVRRDPSVGLSGVHFTCAVVDMQMRALSSGKEQQLSPGRCCRLPSFPCVFLGISVASMHLLASVAVVLEPTVPRLYKYAKETWQGTHRGKMLSREAQAL